MWWLVKSFNRILKFKILLQLASTNPLKAPLVIKIIIKKLNKNQFIFFFSKKVNEKFY